MIKENFTMSILNSNRDVLGRTPLLVAIIRKEKWETIEKLLNSVSVNEADFKGNTCLHYVLRNLHYEDLDMVKEFLNYGADVNLQNFEGNSALHLAAGHILFKFRLIKKLLYCGGDPNLTNIDGDTPLHIAIKENCTFKISANIDDIRDLLNHGANPNTKNGQSLTPMHIAVSAGYGHEEVIEELLNHRATVSVQGEKKIIHSAVRNLLCDDQIILKLVYENPLLLNCNETYKGTPLHLAVNVLRYSTVDLFLANGAEVNTRDGHSNMPLHIAAQNHNSDIKLFGTLLRSGAIVNCHNYFKCTPLLEAARLSKSHGVEVLLLHGAEVNAVDVTGNSALHYAVDNMYMTLHGVKVLLEYGGDPDALNNEHVTPLYYCSQECYAQILIQYTVLKKFHLGYYNSVIDPEKILDLNVFNTSPNYSQLLHFRDLCIEDVHRMRNDKIGTNYITLYDFVLERCSKPKLYHSNSDTTYIYEVLIRLSEDIYYSCREIITAALKFDDLLNVLTGLKVYANCIIPGTRKTKTIILNSYIVEYLVQFLTREDMVNLALVYLNTI